MTVSPQIHDQAIRHLNDVRNFASLGPQLHCDAAHGDGYGPANPVSLFWARGAGFDGTSQLLLFIEDDKGNNLEPQSPPIVDVASGIFSTTFTWSRLAVSSYDGLPTPVLHAKSPEGVEAWTPLKVEDVYITQ